VGDGSQKCADAAKAMNIPDATIVTVADLQG
jgi:hypothetical protein